MSDPILDRVNIVSVRLLLYVLLSLSASGGFWYGVMRKIYGVDLDRLWDLTNAAIQFQWLGRDPTHIIIFWLCAALAISLVANLYLLIAWGIKAKSEVHIRGAYMIDQRGES